MCPHGCTAWQIAYNRNRWEQSRMCLNKRYIEPVLAMLLGPLVAVEPVLATMGRVAVRAVAIAPPNELIDRELVTDLKPAGTPRLSNENERRQLITSRSKPIGPDSLLAPRIEIGMSIVVQSLRFSTGMG